MKEASHLYYWTLDLIHVLGSTRGNNEQDISDMAIYRRVIIVFADGVL